MLWEYISCVAFVHADFRSESDITERDARSASSLPYDDIDEVVEAQPLTSQAASTGALRGRSIQQDGTLNQSDGKFQSHHTILSCWLLLTLSAVTPTKFLYAAVFLFTDGVTYEVDDPQENYDDIDVSPEVTQTTAEVHDSLAPTPESNTGAPPEVVQEDGDYVEPDKDGWAKNWDWNKNPIWQITPKPI